MQLNFEKITVENFTPYEKFSVDFLPGKTVITGRNEDEFSSNGAGKSTLFESLFWGLFGKLMRDGGHPSPLVKNTDVVVELDFMVDSVPYRIIRKKNTKSVDLKLISRKSSGDEDISLGTTTMIQDLVHKLIKFTPETFLATTLFDGSTHTSFATMTDAGQKKLFSDLLQLDIWVKCEAEAKARAAKVQDSLGDLALETVKLNETVKTLRQLYLEAKNKLDILKEPNIEDYRGAADASMLSKELATYKESLKKKKLSRDLILASEEAAKQTRGEIALIESEIRNVELKKMQIQSDIKAMNEKMKHLEAGVCPECKQTLKKSKDMIEELTVKVHKALMQIQKIDREHEDLISKVSLLRTGIDKHDWTESQKISQEISEIESKIRQHEYELDKIKKAHDKYKEDLNTYKQAVKQREEQLAGLSKKGANAWAVLTDKNAEWAKLKEDKDAYDYLIKMFGKAGIQTSLIRGIELPLNHVLKEFTTLFGFKETSVELSTYTTLASGEIRDRISVALVNGKSKREFKSFSQGERRRLDLVFFLALREMLSARLSTNLIVFDEVINNLDQTGVESLRILIDSKLSGICTWIAIPTEYFEWSCQHQFTAIKKGGKACLQKV